MTSVTAPEVKAVVVTEAFNSCRDDPDRVNADVRPAEPLLVNASESMLTAPRLLVVFTLVVPPNTREKVPVVLTAVDQFPELPQLPFTVPRHELSVPACAAPPESKQPKTSRLQTGIARKEPQ
jgi:hypothetical protein